jgi:HD-GYP domain-containing protein (c-di-GMP phosphodiesterase class II)
VAAIVRHHHEHWDGTGYPEGLAGESIPIGARIVCIANALDALLHVRPYRPAHSLEEAIAILEKDAGCEFDPELVRLLVELLREGKVAVG